MTAFGRPPMELDPCTCGHARGSHHAWWNSDNPHTTFMGCGGNPGETCVCKEFVLDRRKMPVEQFDDYQTSTKATAVYPGDVGLPYLALGLGSEAGEVQGVVKRCLRGDYGPNYLAAKDAMLAELGDALWYLARLAAVFDLKLSDVATANLAKLRDRKERGVLKGKGDDR